MPAADASALNAYVELLSMIRKYVPFELLLKSPRNEFVLVILRPLGDDPFVISVRPEMIIERPEQAVILISPSFSTSTVAGVVLAEHGR